MHDYIRPLFPPKNHPADDVPFVREWSARHLHCQACGADYRPLQTHHIIGGRGGRADEGCNLLRLCGHPCHLLAERLDVRDDATGELLPKLTLGVQLWLKLKAGELDAADLERLTVLHGRRLPELEAVPKFFADLYRRNRPELH